MPPASSRWRTPPVLARRDVTLAAAVRISALVLPATSSHTSLGLAPAPVVVAATGPPTYRTGDRRLTYWAGGNTVTLTYPRSATSADAPVAQAEHGSSQLGRSESTVGSVDSNDDSRHWFSVEPTLRAVEGVVTPFDPARSPYLFYSLTASSTHRHVRPERRRAPLPLRHDPGARRPLRPVRLRPGTRGTHRSGHHRRDAVERQPRALRNGAGRRGRHRAVVAAFVGTYA